MIKLIMPKFWYHRGPLGYLLWPFGFCYRIFICWYRWYFQLLRQIRPLHLNVPIIVVGNITVGGTGKTPLVIYLVHLLRQHGYKPGIVSRGFGGACGSNVVTVSNTSRVAEVGDEALLLVRHASCPVVVGRNRVAAAKKLLKEYQCDVILSDDGLQHYRLSRELEIVVIDNGFGLGNHYCLPAGPLREPPSRLQHVDFIIKNYNTTPLHNFISPNHANSNKEYRMELAVVGLRNLQDPDVLENIEFFKNKTVHAVAGIGRPERFFQSLRELGLDIVEHPFPDHHIYQDVDFAWGEEGVTIMTEKDAIKCGIIAHKNFWYLQVTAQLGEDFTENFLCVLKNRTIG